MLNILQISNVINFLLIFFIREVFWLKTQRNNSNDDNVNNLNDNNIYVNQFSPYTYIERKLTEAVFVTKYIRWSNYKFNSGMKKFTNRLQWRVKLVSFYILKYFVNSIYMYRGICKSCVVIQLTVRITLNGFYQYK